MRWISLLVVALFLSASAGTADAQAFKPRSGSKTTTKKAPKKAPKKASTKKASKSSSKKSAKKSRDDDSEKSRSPEDADDYVLIEDD